MIIIGFPAAIAIPVFLQRAKAGHLHQGRRVDGRQGGRDLLRPAAAAPTLTSPRRCGADVVRSTARSGSPHKVSNGTLLGAETLTSDTARCVPATNANGGRRPAMLRLDRPGRPARASSKLPPRNHSSHNRVVVDHVGFLCHPEPPSGTRATAKPCGTPEAEPQNQEPDRRGRSEW